MTDLATHLETEIAPRLIGDLTAEWAKLLPVIKSEGLEAAMLKLAPSAELQSIVALLTAELVRGRETKVVGEVFSGKRVLRLTKLLSHLLKPQRGVPIVTTNYDRLVEVACAEAGLGVDTMFVGALVGRLNEKESRLSFCRDARLNGRQPQLLYRERALIYKPHGSLDWHLRGDKPVRYEGALPATPLIITPGLNKFRGGYDSPFDLHRDRANAAIDRASRFLIVGYGFNDDHLETHLGPMIRGGKPTLLLTRSLSPNALSLVRGNDNVLALEHTTDGGQDSTRVHSGNSEVVLSGSYMWDVDGLISEALQP